MLDEMKGLFARLGRRERATAVLVERPRIVNPYHAVSIIAGQHACEAAKERVGQRFLSREAPRLPLADCECTECRCRYVHHDDRRAFARRISDNHDEMPPSPYSGPERRTRSNPGRRIRD